MTAKLAPNAGPLAIPLPSFGASGRLEYIKALVADSYGLDRSLMTSPERQWDVAHPRQVAMYLAATITRESMVEIGRAFGNRDHSTVSYALQAVAERMDKDPMLKADVEALQHALEALAA